MKFEEALAALREGEKIWHPTFSDDEYLAGCYVGMPDYYDDNGKLVVETFGERKSRGMSIVRVKDDRQHDSMAGRLNYVAKIKRELKKILSEEDFKKYHRCLWTEIEISKIFDEDVFMYPQLNLFLIMSDDWKILR